MEGLYDLSMINHGTLALDKEYNIYVVIGMPPLPGTVYAYLKYRLCSIDTPWRQRITGLRFCRRIRVYTPRTIVHSTPRLVLDPRFNVNVPILGLDEIYVLIDPRKSLIDMINHPTNQMQYKLVNIVNEILSSGVRLNDLGITGSIPLGIAHPRSDIDLLSYGERQAVLLYEWMKGKKRYISKETLQSFIERYKPDEKTISLLLSTRTRIKLGNAEVSIIMAQDTLWGPGKRIACGIDPEKIVVVNQHRKRVRLHIESRQPNALTYPPCVVSMDGDTVLSFDHLLSTILYEGGIYDAHVIEVQTNEGNRIFLLGVRERTRFRML